MKNPIGTLSIQLFIITGLLLAFAGCKKSNDLSANGQIYTDAKGTKVIVNTANWYLTRQGNGGTVNLKLSGTTNADRITITTYGDGLASDYGVKITGGQFNADAGISFSVTAVPAGTFQSSTTLKAFRGTDTLVTKLNSGDLHY